MKYAAGNDCSTEINLLRVELAESRYGVDLRLYEDGQSLSKEFLRLSLAGIAVVGFLLPLLPKLRPCGDLADGLFKFLLSTSVTVFALSAAATLFQRYYASGAMFHHIKAMKLASLGDASLVERIEEDINLRTSKFSVAHHLLMTTSICLFAGAALLAAAFIRLMVLL
jgi:hypothetical protein